MKKKFALALSGGGFKGAFQVGALDYILNNPITIADETVEIDHFDIVTGVSAGALNGALIATGQLDLLNHIWFEIMPEKGMDTVFHSKYYNNGKADPEAIFKDLMPKFGFFQKLGLLFTKNKAKEIGAMVIENLAKVRSLADNKPLHDLLNQYLTLEQFLESETVYKMGFVSLVDGKYYALHASDFDSTVELNKAILASSAMPVFTPPVEQIRVNANHPPIFDNVDGGIRNVSPLKDVIDEINKDPDPEAHYHIFIINCHTPDLDLRSIKYNIVSIAERALLDITLSEIFNNDVDQFLFVNQILRQQGLSSLNMGGKTYRAFDVTVIQPEAHLGDYMDASADMLQMRRKEGQRVAAHLLPATMVSA